MSHHLEVIQISMQLTSQAGLPQVLSYLIFLLVLILPTQRGMGRLSQPMECSTAGPSHLSHYGAMLAGWVTHPCINQAYDCLTSVIKCKTFRINNPALNSNIGKMYIPEIFNIPHTTVQQVSSQLAIQKEQMSSPFGYMNSTPLGYKSFRSCLPTVKSWRSSSDWNKKCLLIRKA